jgi:hypothetical protein
MRIKTIVSAAKETPLLVEAVRFGNKEKLEVAQKFNDFRIGIEYEFEVDTSLLGSGGSDHEPSSYDIGEEAERIVQSDMSHLISELAPLISGVVDYIEMSDILNFRDSSPNQPVDSDFYQEVSNTLEELQADDIFEGVIALTEFESRYKNARGFVQFSEACEEEYGVNFVTYKYKPSLARACRYLINAELREDTKLDILAAFKDFSDDFYDVFDELETHFLRGSAASVAASIRNAMSSTSVVRDQAHDNLVARYEEEIGGGEGGNEEAVQFVDSELPRHLQSQIEGVVEDSSLQHGAEVVTEPLDLKSAISFMEDMFAFIQKHGYTDNGCGMHVNISHRLMGKQPRLNPLRILTLLDPDFFQNRSLNRKLDKYEERAKYAQSFGGILSRQDILASLVESYAVRGFDALEADLTSYLVRSEKYRAINFTALFNVEQEDRRRVEVRLFGGKNYETRIDEITHDIYNLCYVIQAMVDPEFKKREHLEGIIRLLNRASARFDRNMKTTFMDLVARYRKTGNIFSADLQTLAMF